MNSARIQELFTGFDRANILVLGDFMIDEYRSGRAVRLSPEAPVPLILEHGIRRLPGGAGNVVKNLAALKVRSLAIGLKGKDEGGVLLEELLSGAQVLSLVEDSSRPTTRKTRILAGNQQICRLDQEDPSPVGVPTEDLLIAEIDRLAAEASAVIISDYDKGVVTERVIGAVISAAARKGAFVSVDPQVSRFGTYKRVGVLTPNHHEAGRFIGRRLETDHEVEQGGQEIMHRLEPQMLLITRGEKGMSLFDQKGCRHFPTRAREVFDVTGAGDTVITVFTAVIAAGGTPEEAVFLSNQAAGMVVAKLGAATVTREEILTGNAESTAS